MELIGNTPEESAYHEAGHIVIAAAVGLDLRPAGVILFETGKVAGGIACYWEDAELEPVLKALRAGQQAQLKKFPGSEFRTGQCDVNAFFAAVQEIPVGRRGEMWQQISSEVEGLISENWTAIAEVARALLCCAPRPIDASDAKYLSPEELFFVKGKRQLAGNEVVTILHQHRIPARVREQVTTSESSGGVKISDACRSPGGLNELLF